MLSDHEERAGAPAAVLLGLDAENMARLRDGEPISVNLRNLDPDVPREDLPDIDVVIFFAGADEVEVLRKMPRR
jgi:hypothetical protein